MVIWVASLLYVYWEKEGCCSIDVIEILHPMLQSLEALQDGELEKQRRYFLYFLLHQVPVSSNFSVLTRKLACQVITFRFLHDGCT